VQKPLWPLSLPKRPVQTPPLAVEPVETTSAETPLAVEPVETTSAETPLAVELVETTSAETPLAVEPQQ
jgi:hypothetical protein